MSDKPVIAFDYGTQNIGVAVGNPLLGSANTLDILPAREGIPNWDTIASLLDQWQPAYVVVGLPLNMDDTESELSLRARKFANRLHGRFGIAVELYDERLTTREAKDIVKEHGLSPKGGRVDALAARLLLESWFRQQTSSIG